MANAQVSADTGEDHDLYREEQQVKEEQLLFSGACKRGRAEWSRRVSITGDPSLDWEALE